VKGSSRQSFQPEMTNAGLAFSMTTVAVDEHGEKRDIELVGERASPLCR